jgi:ubiquinone/menaquinone biosynthesis C-methylase UbiE
MIGIVSPTRGRFSGVSRIVEFNWPQYVAGASCVVMALAMTTLLGLPTWFVASLLVGTGLAAWWLIASLIASWWIYDRSTLMRLTWLATACPKLSTPGCRILNVHSGYDDTSETLKHTFSRGALTVLDLFDPVRMTEPSIRRARKAYPSFPGTLTGNSDAWPFESKSFDAVLLMMSAHEFRIARDRESLFAEAKRVLAPHGVIVLVEHLRNGANLVSFGPGFMHFWPRREWLRLASVTGLRVAQEGRITPLVGYFVLEN